MKRVLAIGSLLSALVGCGTAANFARESPSHATPYGGVQIAVDRFEAPPGIPGALIYSDSARAADVVFSAVGDTLTLPIAVALVAWRACDLALHYDNTPPRSNAWREFWFGEQESLSPAAP
ncbi:MAG: hypothetical protein J0I06_17010 [Planctomycetes bacterium]|nr:hypothetical protein [Planctomycetota bacterium]